MIYDGKVLTWEGQRYKATSGMPGFQTQSESCIRDIGPILEGHYYLFLSDKGKAVIETGRYKLNPDWGMQTTPRGDDARHCEAYFDNWRRKGAHLEPSNKTTRNRCAPVTRRVFYLHDSTKGFSHGCIKVETCLFTRLHNFRETNHKEKLILKTAYPVGGPTYGGTDN